MSNILIKIQMFMDKLNRGEATLDQKIVDEFAETCRKLLADRLNEKPREFTLRISNLGRPLCQLIMEKNKAKAESNELFFPAKMIFGNMIEAMAVAVMKSAGINIDAEQMAVTTPDGVHGTLDVIIDGKVFDVKSASSWAFEHKFQNVTIEQFYENDAFGYLTQIFSYANSINLPVGGFIVVNKETGEFTVLEFKYSEEFKQKVLNNAKATQDALNENKPFERCFSDIEETYYKTPTGNRVLSTVCSFCKYKWSCWPTLQLLPQRNSKAQQPRLTYYTHIQEAK